MGRAAERLDRRAHVIGRQIQWRLVVGQLATPESGWRFDRGIGHQAVLPRREIRQVAVDGREDHWPACPLRGWM